MKLTFRECAEPFGFAHKILFLITGVSTVFDFVVALESALLLLIVTPASKHTCTPRIMDVFAKVASYTISRFEISLPEQSLCAERMG